MILLHSHTKNIHLESPDATLFIQASRLIDIKNTINKHHNIFLENYDLQSDFLDEMEIAFSYIQIDYSNLDYKDKSCIKSFPATYSCVINCDLFEYSAKEPFQYFDEDPPEFDLKGLETLFFTEEVFKFINDIGFEKNLKLKENIMPCLSETVKTLNVKINVKDVNNDETIDVYSISRDNIKSHDVESSTNKKFTIMITVTFDENKDDPLSTVVKQIKEVFSIFDSHSMLKKDVEELQKFINLNHGNDTDVAFFSQDIKDNIDEIRRLFNNIKIIEHDLKEQCVPDKYLSSASAKPMCGPLPHIL